VPLTRAYALLTVKAVDTQQRTITGIASTPQPDRMGDVVEPLGISYKNPLPLLLYHDAKKPVGQVTFKKPTVDGLEFSATLPTIDTPGTLHDRVEEAWQSLKAGLLAGVSIGFRAIEEAFNKDTGGYRYLKTEVLELSLVAIPANADATIHTIKSLDLAASGRHPSRDRDSLPIVRVDKGAPRMDNQKKTYAERIAAQEHTRAAKVARLETIQDAATDRTKSEPEREEFDNLKADIASIDTELGDLRDMEKIALTKATPITAKTPEEASAQRSTSAHTVQITSPLPKATAFIRYCQALAVTKGSIMHAVEYAKKWEDSTPEVGLVLKAAVAAGTTTDATWAGPLAPITPLAADFLALLRPQTILGKVDTFFRVPFNISVPAQTGGGTYQWVGQGAPKPVGKLAFSTITLAILKCAGIIVITEELARTSTPSAEEVIRRDMIAGIAAFLDTQFIDPAQAPVAGVSPGSVTNGVTPITTAGPTPANARTDIQALANAMTAALIPSAGAVLILSETNALALTNALNPLGQPLFPGMAQGGGMIMGYKAIASQSAGNTVALVQPSAIFYADDGGVTIDVSREASLQMDSALDNPPLATTLLTSLWQMNLVGLRAERFINWKKARAGVVQYTAATYTA
jgi:HK97 family phage major capsid protein/HK97 family phage prohead protease